MSIPSSIVARHAATFTRLRNERLFALVTKTSSSTNFGSRNYFSSSSAKTRLRAENSISSSSLTSCLCKTNRNAFWSLRRRFSSTPQLQHGDITPPRPGEEIHVTFIDKEGDEHHFKVAEGDNLLDIAQANDLEMEGACGGSCACSTCHVIVEDQDIYDKLEEPDDDENDMLDLAFGLTETSRLGCQVKMSKEIDGMRVKLPAMTRNLQSSDFNQMSSSQTQ